VTEQEQPSEGFRISDRRLIDPVTHQPRQQTEAPAAAAAGPAAPGPDVPGAAPGAQPTAPEGSLPAPDQAAEQVALAEANARAEEALADVKRIAAEYANYRRRVDRDRELQRDLAIGSVIADLLPILDDIGRARSHDELSGGFRSVSEALEAVAAKHGLEPYGSADEPFDPNVHQAMTTHHSDEVEVPTVATVYQVGYRLRGRVLRPAMVAVADNG